MLASDDAARLTLYCLCASSYRLLFLGNTILFSVAPFNIPSSCILTNATFGSLYFVAKSALDSGKYAYEIASVIESNC